jgi:putative transposase
MSETYQSLSHSRWDCRYHVVFVPKRRRKALCESIRQKLGRIDLYVIKRAGAWM